MGMTTELEIVEHRTNGAFSIYASTDFRRAIRNDRQAVREIWQRLIKQGSFEFAHTHGQHCYKLTLRELGHTIDEYVKP